MQIKGTNKPGGSVVKSPDPPAKQELQFWSLGQEDPWRRTWQRTLVFLPGKSRGQRSLAGYSPWGLKESDLTEQLSTCFTDITSHQKRNTFSSLNQIYKLSCVSIRISIFFFSWKKFTFSYWKPITYFVQWRKTRNVHLHQSQWRSVS